MVVLPRSFLLLKISIFITEIATDYCESLGDQTYFRKIYERGCSLPLADIISSHSVQSQTECSLKCLKERKCVGFNYKSTSSSKYVRNCQISNKTKGEASDQGKEETNENWTFYLQFKTRSDEDFAVKVDDNSRVNKPCDLDDVASCKELYQRRPGFGNGYYEFETLQAYCDLANNGWTLVARFSNADAKNWMKNSFFWYDKETPHGEINSPSHNADMISPAFWNVKGDEFKITRSDDSNHVALLQTTSRCLKDIPFRSKITSYGAFRNGTEWASNECIGRCEVIYSAGGEHKNAVGFGQYNCTGSVQRSNYIGFWCYWPYDGAVLMIGGGGDKCERADHGIGITELNSAMFGGDEDYYDFGEINDYIPNAASAYSLNLWVR